MDLKLKIAANTLVQILGKIVTAGATFLITILVARNYGVSGFGEFTKIITYVSLFYLIVDFGMNAVYLREESRIQTDKEQIKTDSWINFLTLRIVWALALIFMALAILVFLPYNSLTLQGFTPLSKLGIIILAPTILTQAIFVSCNALFQKNLRYDKSVIAASIGSLLTLFLIFIFTKLKVSLLFVVGSYLISGGIMVIFSFLFLKQLSLIPVSLAPEKYPYLRRYSVLSMYIFGKKLFLKSLPLGLTLIFNLIYFRADTFILTIFRSTEEVGIYGLAYKFFEFPLAIATFFLNALYPVLLKQWNNKTMEQWNNMIKKSTVFLLLSSLLLAVSSLLLAPLMTLIKQDFTASILPFRILSLSLPFFFLSSLFMWSLIVQGKQWLLVRIYGGVMVVNILLNLFFIPRFSYNAAAVITGLTEAMVLFLTGKAVIKYRT